MNPETTTPDLKPANSNRKHLNRLKFAAVLFTLFGVGLFVYFIYTVGVGEILAGIGNIGFDGFALVLLIYFLRILCRAIAWRMSVFEPHEIKLRDTIPAVIIGEALSSLIPLGILISGTAKAVAVRHRVPFVVGLSSVATENLFYSLVTGLFIVFGGFVFVREFALPETLTIAIDVLIFLVLILIVVGVLIIVRHWHWASAVCEWLYRKGFAKGILEHGRGEVLLFENLIYGFYRHYPRRFAPIILLQILYHALGVLEAWVILSRIAERAPDLFSAFMLESVSRIVTTVFKLVPFLIGVDEAGAQIVTETLALGAGLGVTLAIIRKGRIIFWVFVGLVLLVRRGLSFKEIAKISGSRSQY